MNRWVKNTKSMIQLQTILNAFLFYLLQLLDVSISAFFFLIGIPILITSSAIVLKICAITAGIKKYKSIIKKNKRKNDQTVVSKI